jgi:hypothetical protein
MRRLAGIPYLTFAVFLLWKLALLISTAQPVPANDSFSYDGPVINYLLHGKYCNPALALVFPISGNEVFCLYPPLHQLVLLGWMQCFGTSAFVAMGFHTALLGVYVFTLGLLFRALKIPPVAGNVAGLFLFGITFHDRPDSLAHCLGLLALLAGVRSRPWPAAALLLLTFGTSLQLGGFYSLWIGLLMFATGGLNRTRFPVVPAVALFGTLAALVAWVKWGYPHLWEGFQENVKVTPAVTAPRIPALHELLKVGRAAPGILLLTLVTAGMLARGQLNRTALRQSPRLVTLICGLLTALAVLLGCLSVLGPNMILVAYYGQPLLVACLLGEFAAPTAGGLRQGRLQAWFAAAALLLSLRAIGMTTWGVLCARDVSRREAEAVVQRELDACPDHSTVLLSASFLYTAAPHTNLTWRHADWTAPASSGNWESAGLLAIKPVKLIVNQMDYHLHYRAVLADLQQRQPAVTVRITNLARVSPPDAYPAVRKFVQHLSWAPVIVDFSWPRTVEPQ